MKVLLINGSPHAKGCTYTALNEVSRELEKCGIETELVHIGGKPVIGCNGCGKCYDGSNKCVFTDDAVNDVLEKSKTCDGFIIGSPVYYASANGSLVSFLDRMFYAGKFFAYKPGAAIVSARRAGTTASLDQLNKYFTISQMPLVTSQYWTMVHGTSPEEVKKDLEGMQTVRVLGQNMAWLLKCIEAGKNSGIEFPVKEERVRTNFIR
ncbi:MAG: flavodoxin family protein [Spirochaetes bacterium]|nr:flavodoxin family protein [Spirochaetota bacterium]